MTDTETPSESIKPFRIRDHISPRGVGRFVVSSSVRFIVTSSISSLVPTETKTEKVKVFVGSYVIAELVADKAKELYDAQIDGIMEKLDSLDKKLPASLEPSVETDIPNS